MSLVTRIAVVFHRVDSILNRSVHKSRVIYSQVMATVLLIFVLTITILSLLDVNIFHKFYPQYYSVSVVSVVLLLQVILIIWYNSIMYTNVYRRSVIIMARKAQTRPFFVRNPASTSSTTGASCRRTSVDRAGAAELDPDWRDQKAAVI